MLTTILHRAEPFHPAEALGEIAWGRKTQHLGNEGEIMIGLPQKEAALLHTAGDEIVNRGGTKLLAEGVGQIILVHME